MNSITGSPSLIDAMRTAFEPSPMDRVIPTAFGVPIHSSAVFPFDAACKVCNGSGEGIDSTYCAKCTGRGKTRYEGVMQDGRQTILLTGSLPRAFEPSWPADTSVPPPPMKGLT